MGAVARGRGKRSVNLAIGRKYAARDEQIAIDCLRQRRDREGMSVRQRVMRSPTQACLHTLLSAFPLQRTGWVLE